LRIWAGKAPSTDRERTHAKRQRVQPELEA
jgi:hypothetical protein